MPGLFSKLLLFFSPKLQKMRCLHCVVKFELRKLGCALTWYENTVPQLRNCVALQRIQKVHCGSCTALQKAKKLNCAFCDALLLVKKIVALCCAALLIQCYLCPPLLYSMKGIMMVKWNWRKSRIIFLQENEHLVYCKIDQLQSCHDLYLSFVCK